MCLLDCWLKALRHLIRTGFQVLLDFLGLVALKCRSRSAHEAENLFLCKQLALSAERPPSIDPPDGRRELDWGEERIANELKLKLGIRVSPRAVGKSLAHGPRSKPSSNALASSIRPISRMSFRSMCPQFGTA
jgi:hypothetical protein